MTKMKMTYALWTMQAENKNQKRYSTKITSRVYERIKIALADIHIPSPMKGKTYEEIHGVERAEAIKQKIKDKRALQIFTDERNNKISIANTGKKFSSPSIESRLARSKRMAGQKQHPEVTKKRADAMRGRPKEVVSCPHCKKEGGISAMCRWHFDNCKDTQCA